MLRLFLPYFQTLFAQKASASERDIFFSRSLTLLVFDKVFSVLTWKNVPLALNKYNYF